MDNEKIKKKIKEIREKYPNVVTIGYGPKVTGGIQTSQISFVIGVKEKKKLSELTPEEIIPSSFWIDNVEILTDVKPVDNIQRVVCPSQCTVNSNTGSRLVQRPIKGGLQIGSDHNCFPGACYIGTLGFIAVDYVSNCLVGVTNSHVTNTDLGGESRRYTSTWSNSQPTYNGFNKRVGQPSPGGDYIGQLVRYVPTLSYNNKVDGALIALSGSVVDFNESFKQFGLSYNSPMEFATTSEIDNLLSTHSTGGIYSSGRTTGPKGPGPCELKISGINVDVDNVPNGFGFYNSIEYVRKNDDCVYPVNGGDSGSALIADFGGVWKIIGLVYAGSAECQGCPFKWGIACRIDDVINELSIYAWDGSPKSFVSTVEYITVPGGSNSDMITCDGKEYWQLGMTTNNNQCV